MKLSVLLTLAVLSSSLADNGERENERERERRRRRGRGGGDPHFSTYDGTKYSFHGQCDLVMARSPTFSNDLGLDLHARTDMRDTWSLISNAALRIGDDIFELANDGTHYINGHPNVALPFQMAGKYEVSTHVIDLDGIGETFYVAKLDDGDEIFISLFKGMISVRVEANLDSTEGMLGRQEKSGMIARDRATVLTDPNMMGAEWQVNDNEPMLFHEVKAPQYPERCIMPSTAATGRRHLKGRSSEFMKVVEDWCAIVDIENRQFCIDDIILTGDFDLARHYAYSF